MAGARVSSRVRTARTRGFRLRRVVAAPMRAGDSRKFRAAQPPASSSSRHHPRAALASASAIHRSSHCYQSVAAT